MMVWSVSGARSHPVRMTAQQIARNARTTLAPFNEFPSITTIAVWLRAQLSTAFKDLQVTASSVLVETAGVCHRDQTMLLAAEEECRRAYRQRIDSGITQCGHGGDAKADGNRCRSECVSVLRMCRLTPRNAVAQNPSVRFGIIDRDLERPLLALFNYSFGHIRVAERMDLNVKFWSTAVT